MGDQKFNFAAKLSQNAGLAARTFVFLEEKFPTKSFSHKSKFGGGQFPPFTLPRRHK